MCAIRGVAVVRTFGIFGADACVRVCEHHAGVDRDCSAVCHGPQGKKEYQLGEGIGMGVCE